MSKYEKYEFSKFEDLVGHTFATSHDTSDIHNPNDHFLILDVFKKNNDLNSYGFKYKWIVSNLFVSDGSGSSTGISLNEFLYKYYYVRKCHHHESIYDTFTMMMNE